MSEMDENEFPEMDQQQEANKMADHEKFVSEMFSEANNPKEKEEEKRKKRGIWFWLSMGAWAFFFIGILTFVVLIWQIKKGAFGELPTAEIIENPDNPLATTVYSIDGVALGKYFTENRTNVVYEELSPYLVDALVSTEDERFYNHAGVDIEALLRVAVKTVLGGNMSSGGGSTITQQLAKNLFDLRNIHRDNNMIIKKMQEWVIAVQLESKYTKEEILTMYLNTVDFLNNSYGIYAASKTYFNKTPAELDRVESAALIGMLKATFYFNPKSNPENNKARRATVFKQMLKNGRITQAQFDTLKEEELLLNLSLENHNTGPAPYFREQLRLFLTNWEQQSGYNIYRDGLRVYTTIDSRVQKHAEEAMHNHMKYLQKEFFKHWKDRKLPWVTDMTLEQQVRWSSRYNWLLKRCKKKYNRRPTDEDIKKDFSTPREMTVFSYRGEIDTTMSPIDSVTYYKHFLQAGMMAVEPATGHILAWVGGINHEHFKYDHVNVNAKRQVGSTFKPFVYLAGLEAGYVPCVTAPNIPVVFDNIITSYTPDGKPIYGTWDARNSPPEYGGKMSLMQGLATSTNTITAWVLKQIGPQAAVDMARRHGIVSKLEPYPAICLGVYDISVYEMVGAFNSFNNNGLWVEPIFVTKIEDQYGNTIETFVPNSKEATDPVNNYTIVRMLQQVVRRGTAVRLISSNYYNIQTPLAGKTGTTQEGADGWFIGFEPGLTAGVWVGGEERKVAFRDMRLGQGARLAMPIFGNFLNAVNADERLSYGDATDFPIPNATNIPKLDCPFYDNTPEPLDEDAVGDPIGF
ncbi:penicillin-binding protein 1A [bacterium]|nr:penicillin-binding protein 1A [bacterium]